MAVASTLSERATNTLWNFETQYAYDPICIAALEEYVVYTQASLVQSEDADPFNFVSIQAKNPSASVRQKLSV